MVISLTCLAINKISQAGEMAGPVKLLLCKQENLISQAPKIKSRVVTHTAVLCWGSRDRSIPEACRPTCLELTRARFSEGTLLQK